MPKKYVVRLTDAEREALNVLVKTKRVSSQKVLRVRALLKADADGPQWTDAEIAGAFACRTKAVENIRERFVTEGFEIALNTHTKGAFYEAFEPAKARSVVRRLEFGHTPKHGSWLNIAENELSAMTRQCVTGRRFATIEDLGKETTPWHEHSNARPRSVDWQFRIDDARVKLKSIYPKLEV